MRAFSVGAPRTGTKTVADTLSSACRAAHEPETERTIEAVLSATRGGADCVRWLHARDRRLGLDVESSHPLGYVVPYIEDAFEAPLYVRTVRHPMLWIRSRVNFHAATDPPVWRAFRRAFWRTPRQVHPASLRMARRLGVYPVEAYLTDYSNRFVLTERYVPGSRRITVRTAEIEERTGDIARFLGLDPEQATPCHSNSRPYEVDVLDHIDAETLRQIVRRTRARPLLRVFDIE